LSASTYFFTKNQRQESSLKKIKQILNKQSLEARPWVIWIWNTAVVKEELKAQMNALIATGVGGVIVKPGKDMAPVFLSDEFFKLFKLTLDIAKDKGVGVRIADDLSMPWSGSFISLCNQNPSLRGQSLVLAESCIKHEKETFEYVPAEPGKTIIIVGRIKDGTLSDTELKTLPMPADKPLEWKVPAGEWRVMVFKKEYVHDLAGGYIPNAYNTRAAQLYIQNILGLFKKHFSRYIGNAFRGFLVEMPAYRTGDGAIPWDDDLVVKFRTKYKKDLLKYLPSLFFDAPQAARIRNQVYAYLDQSMYERFALPIETWAKNVRLSQWVLCPERTIHRTAHALVDGDFHTDKGLAAVGLQNIDGIEENFPHLRSMIDINQDEYRRGTLAVVGRNRSGASATPQSLKTEIDLNLLSGATQIIIDGCFYGIDQRGHLKTPHNPAWYSFLGGYFKPLFDYAARMHELLHECVMIRPVAVLSPAPAIRALYTPHNGDPVRLANQLYHKVVNALIRQNLDFEMLTEEYILHAVVKTGGEFGKTDRKGKVLYRTLVVPYAPLVSRSMLVFLEKLVSKQGTVLFVNDAPKGTFEDGVNSGVTKRIERLLNPKKSASRIVSPDELDLVLAGIPGRTARITSQDDSTPDILCVSTEDHGYTLYGFHNRSERQEFSVKVEVASQKKFTCINCDLGTMIEVGDVHTEGDHSTFSLHLLPQNTVLVAATATPLVVTPSKPAKGVISAFTPLARSYRIVMKNQWSFEPATLNALPLSSLNQRIGLGRDTGGFSHFYESHFQIGTVPEECFLAMSVPSGNLMRMLGARSQIEISFNGTRVDRPVLPSTAFSAVPENGHAAATAPVSSEAISYIVTSKATKTDYLFGAPVILYNVKNLLVKGFNRVALRTSGLLVDPPTVLYPPIILGRFSIVRGQNGWVMEKVGTTVGNDSWTKYGYPYLSGMGMYRQSFEVPHQYNRLILRMSQVTGVVNLKINEKPVGNPFAWHPIEIDITSHCEHKRNELSVTVANTIDNVLRMNGRASGILGDVYLDVL
jgi:hypothetical protein